MSADVNPYACFACRHRVDERGEPRSDVGPRTCTQYPTGIPADILAGAPHDELRGDEAEGRPFELDPAQAGAERAWRAWRELVVRA